MATTGGSLRQGLSSQEVAAKHAAGQNNVTDNSTSRSVSQILRANIFTIFNGILAVAAIVVLLVGEPQDALFALVMVLNAVIGVFSEIRSKRTLDSLAVMHVPTVSVRRDNTEQQVPVEELVAEDIVLLKLGDQVPADGKILEVRGLEVDESALTGESLPVVKQVEDKILSGTNVVAGSGTMLVEVVGEESWVHKLTKEARQFSLAVSEIQLSINQILKWISWLIPFVVAALAWSQVSTEDLSWQMSLVLAISGIVGMIPQGLVLLTSMNFGLAAATLAKKGVLVQELPAVEILARVDILCLDKTGTITTGKIQGREILYAPDTDAKKTVQMLEQLVGTKDNETATVIYHMLSDSKEFCAENPQPKAQAKHQLQNGSYQRSTSYLQSKQSDNQRSDQHQPDNCYRGNSQSLQDTYQQADETIWQRIPFSSTRKWSAIQNETQMWVLGAPEILGDRVKDWQSLVWLHKQVERESANGRRLVALAEGKTPSYVAQSKVPELPREMKLAALCILEEDIRADAATTLEYFRDQGVKVKIISGDLPGTVGSIAREINLLGAKSDEIKVVDSRLLPEENTTEFNDIVANTDVFGRVRPEQKKAIVSALQAQGHTVAMTGDGVNDALALKSADLGIAMGNGAPATKAVSRVVLTKSEFSVLPSVVAEGRRIIANMERVSCLFLSKTVYAMLIAIVVCALGVVYPLLPRHLTYIGWFTIGIPSFFLALAPNRRRYREGFLRRILLSALPAGLLLGIGSLSAYLLVGEATTRGQSAATVVIIVGGLWILGITARPFNWWRVLLLVCMVIGAILGLIVPFVRDFFALQLPNSREWAIILLVAAIVCTLSEIAYRFLPKLTDKIEVEAQH